MEKMDQRVLLANQWAKEMRKKALDMALSTQAMLAPFDLRLPCSCR